MQWLCGSACSASAIHTSLQKAAPLPLASLAAAPHCHQLLSFTRPRPRSVSAVLEALQVAFNALKPLLKGGPPAVRGYRLYVHMERQASNSKLTEAPTVSFWCFVPGVAMHALQATGGGRRCCWGWCCGCWFWCSPCDCRGR